MFWHDSQFPTKNFLALKVVPFSWFINAQTWTSPTKSFRSKNCLLNVLPPTPHLQSPPTLAMTFTFLTPKVYSQVHSICTLSRLFSFSWNNWKGKRSKTVYRIDSPRGMKKIGATKMFHSPSRDGNFDYFEFVCESSCFSLMLWVFWGNFMIEPRSKFHWQKLSR